MKRSLKVVSLALLVLMSIFILGQMSIAAGEKKVDVFQPTVYLKGHEFKSAQEIKLPTSLQKRAYGASETGLYIVRFTGPIMEEWKSQLTKYGARVYDYLPDFAFVVVMNGEVKSRVQSLPYVMETLIYQPGFKLNPALIDEYGVKKWKDGKSEGYFLVQTFDNELTGIQTIVKNAHGKVISQDEKLLKIQIDRQYLSDLAELNNVKYIEEAPTYILMNDIAKGYVDADDLWNLGYDGNGQIVGVADTGLDTGVNDSTMHLDFQGRINSIYALGRENDATDIHGHGTHVAGSVLGDGARSNGQIKGMAPAAHLVFQSILDAGGGLGGLPTDLNDLFQQAYNDGARIHTNSWGAPVYGEYTTSSVHVDQFVRNNRDMIILFSAGNEGPTLGSVGAPGTAKNCITIGASENYRLDKGSYADNPNQIALFSSRGWCTDGRIKPDLVAPGTWILSTRSTVAPDSSFWGPYNSYYAYMGGTSMATPITAGTVAVARQYIMANWGHTPSASLMKAILVNGATDLGFGYPSRDQGWGRVSLVNSLTARELNWVDETTSLTTGNNTTYTYYIESSSTPLRVTMTWTDAPGSTTVSRALVNDLDLKLTDPNGNVYYGNDFTSPYDSSFDRLNNVENVFVEAPQTGTWTVEVLGYNIPAGPQNYSLVVGGDFGSAPIDPIAPTVTLTAPTEGTTVNGIIPIMADAADNVGVTRVDFYVDGNYIGNDTESPYSCNWNSASVNNGSHALTARAFDAAGNNTTSNAVNITVDNIITTINILETFQNYVSNSGVRSHYYYINVTSPGSILLNLSWDTTADLDMFLYNPDGMEVAHAYTLANPELINYIATQTGTYMVEIDAYSGSGTYTLTATHPIDLNVTEYWESTGTVSRQKKFVDYYVQVGTTGTFNIEVLTDSTTVDFDIYVFDASGVEITRADSIYNPEGVCYYPISAAGTYLIRVQTPNNMTNDTPFTIKVNYPKQI